MFKVGVFVKTKEGERLVEWLPERYETYRQAERACHQHDRLHNLPRNKEILAGEHFTLFDNA